MSGLTYDAGALIAADRGDRLLLAFHKRALERGVLPTVPAPVLAQGWRGGQQVHLARLLAGCVVEPFDERDAKTTGVLCAAAGTGDVIDAAVVAGALARGDVVVTSDPQDIQALAAAVNRALVVHTV